MPYSPAMRGVRWWSALLVMLLVFCAANGALAQRRRTGGSFGGGSFGRSGSTSGTRSGGGSSWGSGSRSGRSSWGSGSRSGRRTGRSSVGSGSRSSGSSWSSTPGGRPPTYTGSSGGSTGFSYRTLGIIALALLGIGGLLFYTRHRQSRFPSTSEVIGATGLATDDAMYVGELRLGIDWRARREVQDTLRRLAETGDTRTAQGLAHLLRETVVTLRRAEMAWLYVSQRGEGPVPPRDAQGHFDRLATEARAAFSHELVRGAAGQLHTHEGPAQAPHPTQGEGVVVVSLIVAAYRPLPPLGSPDANQVRIALDDRAALAADQLAALEVVWSPAADDDRMSTAELEQLYPDLRLIDPESIAGRIFCSYCRGPFAMELLACPHCGAPAEASRGNRAPLGAG